MSSAPRTSVRLAQRALITVLLLAGGTLLPIHGPVSAVEDALLVDAITESGCTTTQPCDAPAPSSSGSATSSTQESPEPAPAPDPAPEPSDEPAPSNAPATTSTAASAQSADPVSSSAGSSGQSVGVASADSSTPTSSSGRTLFVRPGGTGNCSSPALACGSVDAAFSRAVGGEIIELAPGSYGSQAVRSNRVASAGFTQPVVVRPALGRAVRPASGVSIATTSVGSVVTGGWQIGVHNLTLQGFTVRGSIQTDRPAAVRNLRIEGMLIDAGTVLLNTVTGGVFVGNELRNGMNRDALNVKDGSSDVLVADNWFHDYRHDPNLPNAHIHVDCIQLFSMSNVRIERNVFDNCSQRALILQVSAGDSRNVSIVNNWFGGCDASDNVCQTANVPFQATGTDVGGNGYSGSGYTIVNNRIDGFAFVESVPGLVFQNNIMDRYFHTTTGGEVCGRAGVDHNLVAQLGRCSSLSPNDRMGSTPAPILTRYPNPGPAPVEGSLETASSSSSLSFANPATAPIADMRGAARCGPPEVGPWELAC